MVLADRPLSLTIRRPLQDPAFVFTNVFTRKVNELADKTAQLIKAEVERQITTKRLVASGSLLRSITSEVQDAKSGKLVKVGSNLIQARVVESGSRPQRGGVFGSRWVSGKPTHKKDSAFMGRIMTWMSQKGISGGRGKAWLIARKIALVGIPSNPNFPLRRPFTNAQRNTRRQVQRLWHIELDKAIQRLNNA